MKKSPKEMLDDAALDAESLRRQRQSEREIVGLRSKLANERAARKQAEADLELTQAKIDFVRSVGDPSPAAIPFKPHKPHGDATAIVVLSDWHVEETVDPNTINGFNEFNLAIAEKRIKRTFEGAVALIESARHLSNIKDCVCALLGDFINGYIHDEGRETNSLSPTEASLFAQDLICGGIDYLLKHAGFKNITIPTCPGNHGRTTDKPRGGATEYCNSYEWLMYRQLERYYRNNPRVQWKVVNGYHNLLDVQGRQVRFHHGHRFKYQGGIAGAFVPIRRKIAGWDKGAAYDIFGHLHSHLKDHHWCMSNCLIGYNSYALDIGAPLTTPSQTLIVFDKKRKPPVLVQEIFCE